MIGLAHLSVLALQQLHAEAVAGAEAEIIDFIVVGFVGQAVGVVLVRREARPAPGADSVELGDQQPPDLARRVLAQQVLDFAVGFGVIAAVLNGVDIPGTDHEGRVDLIEGSAGDEHFAIRDGCHFRRSAHGRVNRVRLPVPDVFAPATDTVGRPVADLHVDGACRRHHTGLVALDRADEALARRQPDNVEVHQRRDRIGAVDDGAVLVVVGGFMHGISVLFARR